MLFLSQNILQCCRIFLISLIPNPPLQLVFRLPICYLMGIKSDSCDWTRTLHACQSAAIECPASVAVSPLSAKLMKYIPKVLNKKSPGIFKSCIFQVYSCSYFKSSLCHALSRFKITRLITPLIVHHSVLLPSLINLTN